MTDDEAYAYLAAVIARGQRALERAEARGSKSVRVDIDDLYALVRLARNGLDIPNLLHQIRTGMRRAILGPNDELLRKLEQDG